MNFKSITKRVSGFVTAVMRSFAAATPVFLSGLRQFNSTYPYRPNHWLEFLRYVSTKPLAKDFSEDLCWKLYLVLRREIARLHIEDGKMLLTYYDSIRECDRTVQITELSSERICAEEQRLTGSTTTFTLSIES